MAKTQHKTIRFVLGDQLSYSLSALQDMTADDIVLMCEVHDEATYVKHHKKKIALLFSAMRHFANELQHKGYAVDYIELDDSANTHSFTGELLRAVERHQAECVMITEPSEYRVGQALQAFAQQHQSVQVDIKEDNRFLCSSDQFTHWAQGRKQLRMEYFYRNMRQQYGILMEGGEPVGGQWNYDQDNRKPPKTGLTIPEPTQFEPDNVTRSVLELVEEHFADHFGALEPFGYAVTRQQALEVLREFIKVRLSDFGTYQDAMVSDQSWMFHAHISFYLNCGLLLPLECIHAAEEAYDLGQAPLNAVEGFIRQILGWREYIRGIYWLKMPEYAKYNYLEAKHPLPDFYWSGDTKMNCLRQCVQSTHQHAYAHHIQRLMVLGNFALLLGVAPDALNEWYLVVYADAYEWVEMPNVTGMVLFADGGLLASKPYAASGAYINRMSDYCKQCHYRVKEKVGERACPFNYLYWDFIQRHRDKLSNNPRMKMMYHQWDKLSASLQDEIKVQASMFRDAL